MNISEEELTYITKIYQHAIGHLTEDTIPNRIICIHNLHWCVENVLRKATKDYNLNYRDGFETIFKKFISKGHDVPKKLEKSVIKLNEMRNGVEHREIYPDISVIRNLIPDIEKFIKWMIEKIFDSTIDLHSISSADEDEVLENFIEWQENKLSANYLKSYKRNKEYYDYVFICLIPATYSPDLVDISFDGVNEMTGTTLPSGVMISGTNPEHRSKIENYYREASYLFRSPAQAYTVSTHFTYHNEFYGNEMKVFPNGIVYICYKYRMFNPQKPTFNMDRLFDKNDSYVISNLVKKYGISISSYYPMNIEDILKVVCFPFHPDCKEKLVKNTTEYFRIFIILPKMSFEGTDRILDRAGDFEHIFETNREYGGDSDNIIFKDTFKYDEIPNSVQKFRNFAYGFFRNKSHTAFM